MAKLVVISTAQAGLSYQLGRHWVTIGRSPTNAFQIAESSISAQHCEVRSRGNELDVRDMRSTNGTFIKGTMITEGVLRAGEILRLGEIELRLEAPGSRSTDLLGAHPTELAHPEKNGQKLSTSGANSGGKRRQVLLVDDSMAMLETAGELFDSFAKGEWEIHKACGADQALGLLAQHEIEIAALDLSMPMLDGAQLLGMIHRRHPEVKKVILTGVPSETNRAYCLANGAELFLEKPVTRDGFRFVFNVLNDLITWDQQEGFSGTLQQVGLTDIIQIECLRRSSCILEVHTAKDRGEIYIESGVIVHATADGLSGQKALHGLLSLNNGRFRLYPFRQPAERTIQGSWEWLLMESARVHDEEKGARNDDETVRIARPIAETNATVAVNSQPPPESGGLEQKDKTNAPAPMLGLPEVGDGLVVVSTYDGKWNPVDGEQR